MRASYEISLEDPQFAPASVVDSYYMAIAVSRAMRKRFIALVFMDSVVLIDQHGEISTISREFFEEDYNLTELPKELTITFRNK